MASKHRIMLNIGDETLFRTLEEEISRVNQESKKKVSRSGFIIEIISQALEDKRNSNHKRFSEKFNRKIRQGFSPFPLDTIFETQHAVNLQGVDYCFLPTEHSCTKEYSFHVHTKDSQKVLIETTSKKVDSYIRTLIENVRGEAFPFPSTTGILNLVFVTSVDYWLSGYKDGIFKFKVNLKAHWKYIPITKIIDCEYSSHIDVFNIIYARFKDIAVSGRSQKQYDRFVYLNLKYKSQLGGFFVGLRYNPFTEEEIGSTLLKLKDEKSEKIFFSQDFFLKYHYHPNLKKFNRRLSRKALEEYENAPDSDFSNTFEKVFAKS